jgi:hypothetical protein
MFGPAELSRMLSASFEKVVMVVPLASGNGQACSLLGRRFHADDWNSRRCRWIGLWKRWWWWCPCLAKKETEEGNPIGRL